MAGITRFEEIDAWKASRQLTNMVYALGNQTGFNRDFGLRDQIRRAAVSVMSNIAEGFESRTDIQFINFWEWREPQLAKSEHNSLSHSIRNISQKISFERHIPWQRSVLVR